MRKTVALFSVCCILLWILPLGAFIKPEQQKTACGGKRAMHMCMMQTGKSSTTTPKPAGVAFTTASALEKHQAPSAASGSDDFLIQALLLRFQDKRMLLTALEINFPQEFFICPPGPVPKR